MEMVSKRHSWRISIRAKSRILDLDLRADNVLPHWGNGGEKVSFAVRFCQSFFLNVSSENRGPVLSNRESTTRRMRASKLLRFFKNIFRTRRGRQQATASADRNFIREFPWSNAALRLLSVVNSKVYPCIGRKWMMWLLMLTFLPFFSYKFGRMILFRIIKLMIKRAPLSIPDMLLNLKSLLPYT